MRTSLLLTGLLAHVISFSQKVYTSLDEAMVSPSLVEHLNLSGQGITELPKNFKELYNLKTLDLSNNKLTSVSFGGYQNRLEEVNLSGNQLTRIPYFLTIHSADRNLVIENNPCSEIKWPAGQWKDITVASFEGRIFAPGTCVIKEASDPKGAFLKILPFGEKAKDWIEIRKKAELSDEQLIAAIEESKTNKLNYFVNRHLSLGNADSIPDYLFYSCSHVGEKIDISGYNMTVFFDTYYLTCGSANRAITWSVVRDLLQIALTYRPKETGGKKNWNSLGWKEVKAVDVAKPALSLLAKPAMLNKGELTPKKEVIYTLVSGETVAFTNEYQLGIDLEDDLYYIYIKRGGKYYVKTAKGTLGPYDRLNTAEPDASRVENFAFEFEATKNGKRYFIIQGVEFGPFPEQESWVSYDSEKGYANIYYEDERGRFIYHKGQLYGPYQTTTYIEYVGDKPVIVSLNKDTIHMSFDNGKTFESVNSTSYNVIEQGRLLYEFNKDGQVYLRFDEQVFGPFSDVYDTKIANDQVSFKYFRNDEVYLYSNGQHFGPYENAWHLADGTMDFGYERGGKSYLFINGTEVGPLTGKFWNMQYDPDDKCYQVVSKEEDKYHLFYNGRSYGPFDELASPKGADFYNLLSCEANSVPLFIGKGADQKYWMGFDQFQRGPFNEKPTLYYSTQNSTTAIVTSETTDGIKKHYVHTGENRVGPFKEVKTCGNYYTEACLGDYIAVAKDFEDKEYFLYHGELFGPFKRVLYDHYTTEQFFINDNGNWYGFRNGTWSGPFAIEGAGDTDYAYYLFDIDEFGNVVQRVDNESGEYSLVNGMKVEGSYRLKYSSANGFIALDEYDLTGFVINNKTYKRADFLTYAWHEETKTFYWLSLEGKNIVRNYVKL